MRAYSAAETALIATGQWESLAKVWVDRGDGTFIDLTDFIDENWIVSIDTTEGIDQPIASATVRVLRQIGEAKSLSPLMRASQANLQTGAYVAALKIGRRMYITSALAPVGEDALTYQRAFDGYIQSIATGGENELVLECGDRAGLELKDTMIETETGYGDVDPTVLIDVEEIMAGVTLAGTAAGSILGDNLSVGYGPDQATVALRVPTSPSYGVWQKEGALLGKLKRMPVFDALRGLADQIGWDVRYLWHDATETYKLTLFTYDRTKVTPDVTIAPEEVIGSASISQDISKVRNKVRSVWEDSTAGMAQTYEVTEDTASRDEYGRRSIHIPKEFTVSLDTLAEIQAFNTAILSDLAWPKWEVTFTVRHRKALELGDLIALEADGVNHDIDLHLGVIGLRNTWEEGGRNGTTEVTAAGAESDEAAIDKVTGRIKGWFDVEAGKGRFPMVSQDVARVVYLRAYRITAGQSITNDVDTTVICNTEKWDMAGAYNTTTGVFTAPFGGEYEFDVGATLASVSSGCTVLGWLLTSTSKRLDGQPQSNNTYNDATPLSVTVSVKGRLTLASGETVAFHVQHDDDAARSTTVGEAYTWFNATCIQRGRSR